MSKLNLASLFTKKSQFGNLTSSLCLGTTKQMTIKAACYCWIKIYSHFNRHIHVKYDEISPHSIKINHKTPPVFSHLIFFTFHNLEIQHFTRKKFLKEFLAVQMIAQVKTEVYFTFACDRREC